MAACVKTVIHNEAQRGIVLRVLYPACAMTAGARPAWTELLSGVEGVSSRPVRRIGRRAR